MAEQHNYGGKSSQFNQPQGANIGEMSGGTVIVNPPPAAPVRPRNEQILLQAVRDEVEDRLEQSLHNQVLINLGKESQPQKVRRPWDVEVRLSRRDGGQMGEDLPEDWGIGQVFGNAKGKLLILGAPGSGKTTMLLDLARELLERARTDVNEPLPVLVNLSSWKEDGQSIADWLREEIRVKYGVSAKLGQQWIEEKKLLPLLDGLDEVAAERQELCAGRINGFLAGDFRPVAVVVCSRLEEYGLYETNLQLQGAICLKPLTLEQMQDYLRDLGQGELAESVAMDGGLRELVEAPLLLSMAVLAFGEVGLEQWRGLTTEADRLTWLLDAYVVARLQKQYAGKAYIVGKVPTARQVRLYLGWLARLMEQQSQTEFSISIMQPYILDHQGLNTYFNYLMILISMLSGTPIAAFLAGIYIILPLSLLDIIFGMSFYDSSLVKWIFIGLFLPCLKTVYDLILPSLMVDRWQEDRLFVIYPVESLFWSWQDWKYAFAAAQRFVTPFGKGYIPMIAFVIGFWVSCFKPRFSVTLPDKVYGSNFLIKSSLLNTLKISLVIWVIFSLPLAILSKSISVFIVMFWLVFMPVTTVNASGFACLQHLALRLTCVLSTGQKMGLRG